VPQYQYQCPNCYYISATQFTSCPRCRRQFSGVQNVDRLHPDYRAAAQRAVQLKVARIVTMKMKLPEQDSTGGCGLQKNGKSSVRGLWELHPTIAIAAVQEWQDLSVDLLMMEHPANELSLSLRRNVCY